MNAKTIQSVLRLSLNVVVLFILLGALTPKSWAASCASLPTAAQLKTFLGQAASGTGISASLGPGTGVGGLFSGQRSDEITRLRVGCHVYLRSHAGLARQSADRQGQGLHG